MDATDQSQPLARRGPPDVERPTLAHWTFLPGPHQLWWSETMYAIHGYAAGGVAPTPELVIAHKQDRYRDEAAAHFVAMAHDDAPFAFPHTIVDAHGEDRHVVVVGQGHRDEHGRVGSFSGYMLDLTDFVLADRAAASRAAVLAATEHRAAIEQAKGMLMMAYGVDADAAVALLKRVSQESNVKVHTIATRLVAVLSTSPDGVDAGRVSALLESLRRP